MKTPRIWEVDFARGLAVIGMVAFNWAFALQYLGRVDFEVHSGAFLYLGRAVALAFVFLAGVSLHLSAMRGKEAGKQADKKQIKSIKRLFLRGLRVFFLGLLITLATYLYEPRATVWFGVLHLIGISIFISAPVAMDGNRKHSSRNLSILGIIIIIADLNLANYSFPTAALLPLGFAPENFYTFDYFPVLPWYGVFLLGLAAGRKFYPEVKTGKEKPETIATFPFSTIPYLGRHSLFIYLAHQPALLLALALWGA